MHHFVDANKKENLYTLGYNLKIKNALSGYNLPKVFSKILFGEIYLFRNFKRLLTLTYYNNGIRTLKGGYLLITITLLITMISFVEGWMLVVTPISVLGVHPATKVPFTYFITLQAIVLGALYKRRNVKPFLAFMGLASLILLNIYSLNDSVLLHNVFAILFFLTQPIIFFLEYKSKKDSYGLSKGAFLIFIALLTWLGIIPLPIFEVIAYGALILFL